MAGVYQLSAAGSGRASGIAGLAACAGAAYCVRAFELEGQQRRPVLPALRRGRAALSTSDAAPAARLVGVNREAGVRQTTWAKAGA